MEHKVRKYASDMLVIHWTKHNNAASIIKNGIRPEMRKSKSGDWESVTGIWCYPYTRHKSMNNNWKHNLKVWDVARTNLNGFVFKLEESDFPIYAGEFGSIRLATEKHLFKTYADFIAVYGKYFNPLRLSSLAHGNLDYQDFELILSGRIDPKRIIKVLQDRPPSKTYDL